MEYGILPPFTNVLLWSKPQFEQRRINEELGGPIEVLESIVVAIDRPGSLNAADDVRGTGETHGPPDEGVRSDGGGPNPTHRVQA